MSDEIAEFLRRAAQRRAEQMQQQLEAQRRAAQQQFAPPPPMPSAPPRQVLGRPPVVEAEIIDDEPVPLRPVQSNVSQHVSQHLDTRDFAERADRLGDATEQADERMEQHLRESFDHRLGNIGSSTGSIMAAETPEIDDEMKGRAVSHHPILSLLRQPQSVRNAMILSELLQRPEQNW